MGIAQFPKIGLGGAGLGNLYRAVSDAEAAAAIEAALSGGISLIDTAPYYGHGLGEARIGVVLHSWGGRKPVLSTKVGRILEACAPRDVGDFGFVDPLPMRPRFDYSRSGIRHSLEGSLERLGLERVDIALVHDVGRQTHGEAHLPVLRQVIGEAIPELERMRSEGLIRYIGIGVNECDVCFDVMREVRLDCILLAGRYTAIEQPALTSGLLDLCAERGVRILAGGIFNSGLLSDTPSRQSTYNYLPATPEALSRAQRFWEICGRFGVPPQAAAIQFPIGHPAVSTVLIGARSATEVAKGLEWRNMPIPAALWMALKEAHLIEPSAPCGGASNKENGSCV
jgi:D-threo-aldose 1-dehydrogenase